MPNQPVMVRMRDHMIKCVLKVCFFLTENTTTSRATSSHIYIYIYINFNHASSCAGTSTKNSTKPQRLQKLGSNDVTFSDILTSRDDFMNLWFRYIKFHSRFTILVQSIILNLSFNSCNVVFYNWQYCTRGKIWFKLVYGLSILAGYLMPNPDYTYMIFKFGWVLWHINHCRLFNAIPFLYMYIKYIIHKHLL